MQLIEVSDAEWTEPAEPTSVGVLRRRSVAFAVEAGASAVLQHSVALAVSEVVTNAVVHAYAGHEPGPVTVRCRTSGGGLVIEVLDAGAGVRAREDSPGIGHGLATVGALVDALELRAPEDGPGTVVRMTFGGEETPREAEGLEPLCALALEHVADVSCVDLVSGGVLRRAAAEVLGAPDLTEWLRGAVPPAKPGTATWAALREGGARLVVHDPSVPRSPGGAGEHLGLAWWVAVPLEAAGGDPAALWGLGGRAGGRPVPSEAVLAALADAGRTDLAEPLAREVLRTRLYAS